MCVIHLYNGSRNSHLYRSHIKHLTSFKLLSRCGSRPVKIRCFSKPVLRAECESVSCFPSRCQTFSFWHVSFRVSVVWMAFKALKATRWVIAKIIPCIGNEEEFKGSPEKKKKKKNTRREKKFSHLKHTWRCQLLKNNHARASFLTASLTSY